MLNTSGGGVRIFRGGSGGFQGVSRGLAAQNRNKRATTNITKTAEATTGAD